jgi:hypothetical protein
VAAIYEYLTERIMGLFFVVNIKLIKQLIAMLIIQLAKHDAINVTYTAQTLY